MLYFLKNITPIIIRVHPLRERNIYAGNIKGNILAPVLGKATKV